jgi:hypothetical protein
VSLSSILKDAGERFYCLGRALGKDYSWCTSKIRLIISIPKTLTVIELLKMTGIALVMKIGITLNLSEPDLIASW